MNPWLNLLYKEYRMSRSSFPILMGVLFIGVLCMQFLSQRYPSETGLFSIIYLLSLVCAFALFCPAVFMFTSISHELKRAPHLWFHCPQPAWMLLSAKLVTGLVYMLVLLLVESILVYWLFNSYSPEQTGITKTNMASFITGIGAYVALAVVNFGLYLASWATLLAVVNARGRNLWPAVLAIFFAATWGINRFEKTWFFEKLTHWGTIQANTLLFNGEYLLSSGNINISFAAGQIYTGENLFYLVLAISIFALSAWLINRKVEV
ncbi:hypothetical protein [Desulfoscipio gibsoniae]|uniref:ABC-2 family transporter protein n=1 Tax=Desulfoscipio gibsoniae DSM 7213 TaxID=767817 RepID=R4KSJ9_9FIRM|nr:hypothetical protein [Desulfoscipio gibsoniae]AGL02561.1 hypothetical protein Desgi_3207 [Desulfoscipio gibsoniae DSM 7213]